MPKISDKKKQERKAQILKAAFKCFSEKGYELTSMREIFDEANLSAGAVYSYFDSKEDILESLALAGKVHFKRVVDQTDDDENRLISVLGKLALLVDKKNGIAGAKVEIGTITASLNNQSLRKILKKNLDTNINVFENLLKKQQGVSHINVNTKNLSRLIIAMVQGLFIQKIIDPSLSIQEIVKTFNNELYNDKAK